MTVMSIFSVNLLALLYVCTNPLTLQLFLTCCLFVLILLIIC